MAKSKNSKAKKVVEPRSLIEVSGGIAEETESWPGVGKPNVQIFDWDNFKDDPASFDLQEYPDWVIKEVKDGIRRLFDHSLHDEECKKEVLEYLDTVK